MYSSRVSSRLGGTGLVAARVPTEGHNANRGAHSKSVGSVWGVEEPQDTHDDGSVCNEHDEAPGSNENAAEAEEDVSTQIGATLKDFDKVINFSAFGRFFQQARTQVMDVAQNPAVKFVESVVTQISDVTEHMDQRVEDFWTGMALPDEADENAAGGSPAELPVSNPSAPVLERPSEPPRELHQPEDVEDWGDFDFDDDSEFADQPVTQETDRGAQQPKSKENMVCRRIDVSGGKDTAAVQRSPLHPHTPHTPALGSPETMVKVHMDQAEKPLQESLHDLLRQDSSKENPLSENELVERCTLLAEQSLLFQQQCQTLMAENTRLKQDHENEGDAVLAEQLAIQVQHLMHEKSRILQEKEWLEKENGNLQQLLEFACASMARASSPGEGGVDEEVSPSRGDQVQLDEVSCASPGCEQEAPGLIDS